MVIIQGFFFFYLLHNNGMLSVLIRIASMFVIKYMNLYQQPGSSNLNG